MSVSDLKKEREDQEKVQLVSDRLLYQEAGAFISEQGTIDGQTQLSSLKAYTQSWDDLMSFVKHQSQREWIGQKAYYRQFYLALDSYLNRLRQQAAKEFPPPENSNAQEKRSWIDHYALLLAREFVQHLAAENLYREKVKK